jgi:6-methylsalicylate decarboxylase
MQLLDLHQHAWTEPLLAALSARRALPFVRREPDGLTILHCAGERPYVIDLDALAASPSARRRRLAGARRALIAISSPVGMEALDPDSAHELIDAHLDGVLALGADFGAWGPLGLADPDPAQVGSLLRRGCAGISVSAGAIADREGFDEMAPALEAVQREGAVLFVHPGPGRHSRVVEPSLSTPLWWPALTRYVEQMQAAWLTFATHGRRELPTLRTVFAMLAGGAPLLSERLVTRGGPRTELDDPHTFYDTSSYGPRMVETMARWVGPSQLVYGSDRPVIDVIPSGREAELMANAAELIPTPVALA